MSDNTTRSFDKNTADVASQHRRVAIKAASIAVVMLGMAYAAGPLYQIFCQVSGFAGTTQRATAAPENVLERKITIRFDSNISNGLVWKIAPTERTADVKIGENRLAFYRATNPTD